MTLEERYNQAGDSSYVGKVRMQQAAEAGPRAGVNFIDGDPRGQWAPGQTPPPDAVQNEFTRNAEGDFRYGGGGKTPAATNDGSYPLSRWLERGTTKGDTYLTNNRFITIGNVRNAPGTPIHWYSHFENRNFIALSLQEGGRSRVNGAPSGPAPSGLNG